MATENHIVNKVSLQLNGLTTQTAFQWQQEMNQYLQDQLPRQLEKMLDENFPSIQWIQIDRLQVNIETGNFFSTRQLQNLIEEELKIQLQKKAATIAGQTGHAETISPFRAWLFFLQDGKLPWWYGTISMAELEQAVKTEMNSEPQRCVTLLQAALKNEAACRRLIMQSSPGLMEQLLSLLRFTQYETAQWERTVQEAVEERLEETFSWIESHQRRIMQLAIRYAFLQKVVMNRERSLKVDEQLIQRIVAALETTSFNAEAMLKKLTGLLSTGPVTDINNIQKKPVANGEENRLQTMVSNAGLVLFHPYLEYFFRAMGILDESGKTILLPGKAVRFLQFLTNGETVCNESETALTKIICGIDESEPVYTQYPFSADEQGECRSLLEAVVRNWPALKNTSPEGLQQTFVQRKGKLSRKDDHWLLQVEQKTVDVLLNSLPWPLSIIRLPWMEGWLQVEWT